MVIKKKAPVKKDISNYIFPIVAIGASAGGLEAVTELLKNLAPDTGMAFIYVQHLSPDHKSMLTSLLAKTTTMKVQEVENKVLMKPNNIYVIPPDKEMDVVKGHIHLKPRPDVPKFNLPIDILFTSLSLTYKENAIGIILSGSASDGTKGMKSIKHEGGLTFAQDDTAKFNSMPKSAIAAGVVDFILSPKEIARELVRLSKHPLTKSIASQKGHEDIIENNNPALKKILNYLYKAKGVDFNAYKMATLKRRIIRRMRLYKINELHEYAKLFELNGEEGEILYQDLLINVTSFFRDTDTYTYLKSTLLPKLLKNKKAGESLRIWVPACSTGEEAFSIAMMLTEIQDTKSSNVPIQIFATDLSDKAIHKGRIGLYSKNELESVSPGRVQRFFSKSDGGYRIAKGVRNMCVFASHNALRDPPFSRLDFISCRNFFIYLDTPAQKKVVNMFHYALNNDGYLMLGKSETISTSPNLFSEVNKKYKIYLRKKNSGTQLLPNLSPSSSAADIPKGKKTGEKISYQPIPRRKSPLINHGLDSAVDAVLIASHMPASVVINHQMDIIQFRGSTDLFLTHAPGQATFNIVKMARPEIAFDLRIAISKAIKNNQQVSQSGLEIKINDVAHYIRLDVIPLDIDWDEPVLLILFAEQEKVEISAPGAKGGRKNSLFTEQRVKQLEKELIVAHADALTFSQEQEAFIEELQSAHEEVVSSNEELQTVNEELETSKEEIESANEELMSTNQELQTRNDLLRESYDYSEAIILNMHEPMLVLNKDLRVKTASKSFYKNFGVREEETEGVLLYDLGNKQWNIPSLRKLLEDIIPKNSHFQDFEITHTFPDIGEKILLLNASRIDQKSHGEQLILLSISDITEIVQLQRLEKDMLKKDIKESRVDNLKLEKAVKQRTNELKLTNKSLAETIAELEKINKELESFAYVSSHDLQEPLRKIQIFAGRILDMENQNLSEKGVQYFHIMQNSANRMQDLINDLLSFSRIGAAKAEFKNINLKTILEEVKFELKEQIEEQAAIIEVHSTCKINVVHSQFRQVLHNLFSNAFKFAKPGGPPHIDITCTIANSNVLNILRLHPNTRYNHISFTDYGIGFDQEYSEKIFAVFEKLHSKDEYAGTGIGLSIVKKIVENHHGIITARSEVNKATTFDIYIPAKHD